MTGHDNRQPIPFEQRVEFWAEKINAVSAALVAAFDKERKISGLTKESIANRIERDKSYISRVFGGQRNLTIRTISEICLAMSCDLIISIRPFRDIPERNYHEGQEYGITPSRIFDHSDTYYTGTTKNTEIRTQAIEP